MAKVFNDTTDAVLDEYVYRYDATDNRVLEQLGASVNSATHNNLNQLTSQSSGGEMVFSGTVDEPATISLDGTPAIVEADGSWIGSADVQTGSNTMALEATDTPRITRLRLQSPEPRRRARPTMTMEIR